MRQNVISSVLQYSGSDCPVSILRYLALDASQRVEALNSALSEGRGAVVSIESSIGCRLVTYFLGDISIEVNTVH